MTKLAAFALGLTLATSAAAMAGPVGRAAGAVQAEALNSVAVKATTAADNGKQFYQSIGGTTPITVSPSTKAAAQNAVNQARAKRADASAKAQQAVAAAKQQAVAAAK